MCRPRSYSESDYQAYLANLLGGMSSEEAAEKLEAGEAALRSALRTREQMTVGDFRDRCVGTPHATTNSATQCDDTEQKASRKLREIRLPTSGSKIGRPAKIHEKTCDFC